MNWLDVVGHEKNIAALRYMVAAGRLSHALLFAGPDGIGKYFTAERLAAALLCGHEQPCGVCPSCQRLAAGNHPDFFVVRPEGTTIKIEQIRNLQRRIALAPYLSALRVTLIDEAGKMTAPAANSLLKTLEEPAGQAVFILIASQREQLLETVRSRCRTMAFGPLPAALLEEALCARGFDRRAAALAARLSGGRFGKALELARGAPPLRQQALAALEKLPDTAAVELLQEADALEKLERPELLAWLDYLTMLLRDRLILCVQPHSRLLYNVDLAETLSRRTEFYRPSFLLAALREAGACRRALESNANPRLALEALLIRLRQFIIEGESHANGSGSAL